MPVRSGTRSPSGLRQPISEHRRRVSPKAQSRPPPVRSDDRGSARTNADARRGSPVSLVIRMRYASGSLARVVDAQRCGSRRCAAIVCVGGQWSLRGITDHRRDPVHVSENEECS